MTSYWRSAILLLVKTLLLLCISPKKSKLRRGKGVQRFSACGSGCAPFFITKQPEKTSGCYGSRLVSSKKCELKKSEMLMFKP